MDLMELGTQLLSDQLSGKVDTNNATNALSSLLGDGQGGVDLAGIVSKMASNGDLGNIVNSWLGDGANSAISAESLLGLLGENQMADFASNLRTDSGSEATTLSEILPQMIDKSSSGGSLLDAAGGLDGLLGAAKSFLK
jgi:uncharacterized protein YidB (DUF937 family)